MFSAIFQIPFLELKLKDWQDKKSRLLSLYSSIEDNVTLNDEVYTDYLNNKYNYSNYVREIFSQELDYIDSVGETKFYIDCVWFEMAKPGNYHGLHNHGALGYTCICYIDNIEPDTSKICFVAPFNDFFTGSVINYWPEIYEGLFLSFPSSLAHYTTPNLTTSNRLVLSFNLLPE